MMNGLLGIVNDDFRPAMLLGVLAVISLWYGLTRRHVTTNKLPPGPKYLGTGRFDMPAEPYKRFVELAGLYGAFSCMFIAPFKSVDTSQDPSLPSNSVIHP